MTPGTAPPPGYPAGDDKRQNRRAVQAENPEKPVHHEGKTGQVTGVFQDGNAEKHEHNHRYETKDPSDPVNNARCDQGFEDTIMHIDINDAPLNQVKRLWSQATGNVLQEKVN
jgi:hypothetical protein